MAGGHCSSVRGKGRTAHQVRVYDRLTCRSARGHLHRWLRRGFPHDMIGWYCDMSHARKLCAVGNGAAPYVTFCLRG